MRGLGWVDDGIEWWKYVGFDRKEEDEDEELKL